MTTFEAISVAISVVTIIFTLIACTWHISWKLSTFVTHQVCKERMLHQEQCASAIQKDLQELKDKVAYKRTKTK